MMMVTYTRLKGADRGETLPDASSLNAVCCHDDSSVAFCSGGDLRIEGPDIKLYITAVNSFSVTIVKAN